MNFYELSKEDRKKLVLKIEGELLSDIRNKCHANFLKWFSDTDTYVRKSSYENIGRICKESPELTSTIISLLRVLFNEKEHLVRQTVVNAAGEIGKINFHLVYDFFDKGLFDQHHTVRNAVIGSIKKMGQKNPRPVIEWARKYLHHPDKEVRREICHGIELRGRTHPQDILPLLKELQFDKTSRVSKTLTHVIGQISYKKGCLEKVIHEIRSWENQALVKEAIDEIIDVHERYKNFSALSQEECKSYIFSQLK